MQLNCRQKKNGLYILSKNDIDKIAQAVLNDYAPNNLLHPAPLDTLDLLENYLGLTVKYSYIGEIDSDILGLTVMDDYAEIPSYDDMLQPIVLKETYGTVLINRNLSGKEKLTRRRFTETHEGAHFMLHKEYFKRAAISVTPQTNYIACRQVELDNMPTSDIEWLEWQADSLAAALLMPKDIFLKTAAASFHRSNIYGVKYLNMASEEDRAKIVNTISELAEIFNVSYIAAKLRLKSLGIVRGPI